MRALLLTLTTCLFIVPAQAQYSGGSGTADDPYQIATAADLIALGETPDDYDKHFILTADIDLDPNLPGGKVFDRAVIAPVTVERSGYSTTIEGEPFVGVFDGDGHSILRLTIEGDGCLGLFGRVTSGGDIRNLTVVNVDVLGFGSRVGGLVGLCDGGTVTHCCSTGTVGGDHYVGGLVGNSGSVGNLIGSHKGGRITGSCSSASVRGTGGYIGGLVGINDGSITGSHATGTVTGTSAALSVPVGVSSGALSLCATVVASFQGTNMWVVS